MSSHTLESSQPSDLKLVFLGERNAGKSTTCNRILRCFGRSEIFGKYEFCRGSEILVHTSDVTRDYGKHFTVNFNHKTNDGKLININILEVPDSYSTWNEEKCIRDIVEPIDKALLEGVTAIIYVTSFETHGWNECSDHYVRKIFGWMVPKDMLNRCVILMTCANKVSESLCYKYCYEYCMNLNHILGGYYPEIRVNPIKFPVFPIENSGSDEIINHSIKVFLDKLLCKWTYVARSNIKALTNLPKYDNLGTHVIIKAMQKYQTP